MTMKVSTFSPRLTGILGQSRSKPMSARIELRWFTPRHAILVGRSAAEVAQRLWVEQSTKEGLDIASPAPL